jgi:hypothetical protein
MSFSILKKIQNFVFREKTSQYSIHFCENHLTLSVIKKKFCWKNQYFLNRRVHLFLSRIYFRENLGKNKYFRENLPKSHVTKIISQKCYLFQRVADKFSFFAGKLGKVNIY